MKPLEPVEILNEFSVAPGVKVNLQEYKLDPKLDKLFNSRVFPSSEFSPSIDKLYSYDSIG